MNEIWILDDESALAGTYKELLSTKYHARAFSSPSEALAAFEKEEPALFITDMKMPEMNGIDLIEKLRKNAKQTPVILVSGYAEKEHLVRASNVGISGFLEKPLEAKHLLEMVDKTISDTKSHEHLLQLNRVLDSRCRKLEALAIRYFDRLARAENILEAKGISQFSTDEEKLTHLLNLGLERTLNEEIRQLRQESARLSLTKTSS
jgi:FixJ family two-component response regulator